jgi:16S rRNA (cytidine1402-2'-O)-methyltransferase
VTHPTGRLILVGTPIGNLEDLSPRAARALATADVIFCEDTRRTRKLLSASAVRAPRLLALHQHNEAAASEEAVRLAAGGSAVAVVTDAGMPGISDPGERVVRLAAERGVVVEVVPGPAAFLAALVASGLATDRFRFEGFLPRKGRERRQRLGELAGSPVTSTLYEAPHRVRRTLADLAEVCGADRRVAIGRELTKLHEEIWRGTLAEALTWVDDSEPRGEWAIVLAGKPPADPGLCSEADIVAALQARMGEGAGRKEAIALVATGLGVPRREVYQLALRLGRERETGAD